MDCVLLNQEHEFGVLTLHVNGLSIQFGCNYGIKAHHINSGLVHVVDDGPNERTGRRRRRRRKKKSEQSW